MSLRLIVMRHAKSSWDSDAPTDHARPLNKRGRRDAPRIAARLVEIGWTPQQVLSSDAQRTRETFELMSEVFDPAPPVEFLSSLYHAGPRDVVYSAAELAASIEVAMVLGHNPGWQTTVAWLSGEQIVMTTANAALLECHGESWPDALRSRGQWTLQEVLRPKEL